MATNSFDLTVIGSGPSGQRGAITAAKRGKKVAVIERAEMIGGICIHGGTIPSKTFREGILYLTGFRQRAFYGPGYTLKETITAPDLAFRVRAVVDHQVGVVTEKLRRNGVTVLRGVARFVDPHTLEIQQDDEDTLRVRAKNILIAAGTRPVANPEIPFDQRQIISPDELETVDRIPRNVIVVGAGVIGLEYASMLAAMDVEVTIIDQRSNILEFVDREIIEALLYHMRRLGATFRLGEKVTSVSVGEDGRVHAHLESGKRIHAEAVLYAVGRQGNSDLLNLEAAGLTADSRGRIAVNEHFQTEVPHIYAAGDIIGFPALASTSMEQGRLAAGHMCGVPSKITRDLLPYGIYTIPEISIIGKTELELTQAKIPYEVGIAKYEELAKGQMVGDQTGLLKILFHSDSLKVLGVHAIGESAVEIIHIGQAVMALDGTVEYFRDTVFNYPTFAEAYKVAAIDGLNKLC
jgi:NAD(P) transhydrogenase